MVALRWSRSPAREHVGAGFDRAHCNAASGKPPQPRKHGVRRVKMRIEATDDDDHGATADIRNRAVDVDCQAVAGTHGSTVVREHLPVVGLAPGYRIRLAQRFHSG
jgi:hypothetical protein